MIQRISVVASVLLFVLAVAACSGKEGAAQERGNTKQPEANKQPVGGGCEGCELMFIGMPENIDAIDTSIGWTERGSKLLVKGTLFKADGKTPAPDVILYYWHTDNEGLYAPGPGMDEGAKLHGHIRGWLQTDAQGRYALYTIRPAPYPNEQLPAHIHISVKEPGIPNEYYIDDLVFEDDPLLTAAKRKALENRGGTGILHVSRVDNMQVAERNITLGLNIPNYPQ